MMTEKEEEKPLLGLGIDFNRGVTLFLSEKPKRSLIYRVTSRHSGLNRDKLLEMLTSVMKDDSLAESSRFLDELKLGSYTACFEAYRYSRIPDIYLQRRKLKSNLTAYPLL